MDSKRKPLSKNTQQNTHFETILDSIADGVFTIDLDFNITYFNRSAETITGVSRDQALGQKCFDVFRANICQTSCALGETIQTGKKGINIPINLLTSQGDRISASVSTSVFMDNQGKTIGGVEIFRDLTAVETLRKNINKQYRFEDILSKNYAIQRIFDILPDIATSGSTILIEGPSGSGKELFARAIHNVSGQKGEFVAVNCAALPDTLLESELFGYKKGAFSEAKKDKPGRFARAAGGTLFLDEIGDISTALQVKLLRFLQEKEYEPLGAISTMKTDARIIASTNRTLSELVARGVFREDLYYRLNVINIELPPLSNRCEDIPLLIQNFIQKFNALKGKEIKGMSDHALNILMRYDFPGNIRELENIIEYAFVLCRGDMIKTKHLSRDIQNGAVKNTAVERHSAPPQLDKAEKDAIVAALDRYRGHRGNTAEFLEIDKSTLWRKMKKYGIK
ncbi:MAG: sigma 54-interacting transcriptional regulator [Desulfobacterales bacterium]|nr:sigma 54-interacting transcriptional regulator [Desulfobacterales bacterium]MDX2511188.1 sigma 54-interacting transcriptional regulator [Desulfobacterales bacterium]